MSQEQSVLPDGLFMDIDRNGPVPLYFQISSRLERAILAGDLPSGSRLENEVHLSERLGLSRPTVRRAIQELVDKGLLVRRRGIGTQVVHGQVTRKVALTSLFEDLSSSGQKPTTTILGFELIPATAIVAESLNVAKGDEVLHIRRVRLADQVPVAVLENFLPTPFLDIDEDQLREHGLYQLLRAKGTTMRVARQKIGARRATSDESELLDVDKGGPVLTVERVAYDSSGRAVEFGHHCYRPDLYSFEVTLVDK
ncbi:MAG: Transcriptional regulator [Glaciihabitans sp.]|nr:Transcriptional regulator [Glaciihabitans sp.]